MRSALVRVLQEALVNVRKHSGARNVTITFGVKDKRSLLRTFEAENGV